MDLGIVDLLRRLLTVDGLLPLIHFDCNDGNALDYARTKNKFEMADMMQSAWNEFVEDDEPQEALSVYLRVLVDFEQSKAEISSVAAEGAVLDSIVRRRSTVSSSNIVQRIEELEKKLEVAEEAKDWKQRDAIRLVKWLTGQRRLQHKTYKQCWRMWKD